jgi:bacterioferritin-associated ferredoxin
MIICVCNPFNDKAVQQYLDKAAVEKRPVDLDELYNHCARNQPKGCGTCYETVLQAMVDEHNEKFLVGPPKP